MSWTNGREEMDGVAVMKINTRCYTIESVA
jgi:hypothetical protein